MELKMIKKSIFLLLFLSVLAVLFGFVFRAVSYTEQSLVASVLMENGESKPIHYLGEIDEVQRKIGEELFLKGQSVIDGKTTPRISKHYVCSSCHNNVLEESDLSVSDANNRLDYSKTNQTAFVQGTTMYGVVNKKTWYNGDYEKKYGSLVTPARDTLQNAVQLCAEVCSQGRRLTEKELNAFMHYFWSLQLKVGDLSLNEEEMKTLNSGVSEDVRSVLKSNYLDHAPATFIPAINYEERKMGEGANPESGKVVYEKGCVHCHSANEGRTNLKLDSDILSYKYLAKATKNHSSQSIYRIVREGTYPIEGYKPYMPHYTKERLSNQQVEDLVAFILLKAKSNE